VRVRPLTLGAAAALAAIGAGALYWRRNPSACPYSQRFWVQAPHPFVTRTRLREALTPSPGERMLEVGPGTGYYALDVAEWIAPGRLDIFDLQQEMLDHTLARAARRGRKNIAAARGDARALPYADASFDAAYLAVVLGEIPDPPAALSELRRVLKPEGRLVVGEVMLDVHFVPMRRLREHAESAGLRFERRVGDPLGFFARFSPA
jgi:ubiquinone/menaquinone biosynthesis C-methylase UbiE